MRALICSMPRQVLARAGNVRDSLGVIGVWKAYHALWLLLLALGSMHPGKQQVTFGTTDKRRTPGGLYGAQHGGENSAATSHPCELPTQKHWRRGLATCGIAQCGVAAVTLVLIATWMYISPSSQCTFSS
jgi:hypothetical protein